MYKEQQERLLEALNEYYNNEGWDSKDSIPEDGLIPLGYTTSDLDDDYEHDIEIKFDLKELCYLNYVDFELVLKEYVYSFEQLLEDLNASFDDISYNCLKKGREIYGGKRWENVSLYLPSLVASLKG